ncbi:MAG: type IV pilus twitching motility protein PilT, partial [Leptospiraceae bacterium]|nr:type IV pilus twitching motility protein PilT [Leptospiraceae bacterium]
DMIPMKMPPMSADVVKHLLYSILTEQQRTDFERDLELDFAITFGEDMRFRVNVFNTVSGPAAVLRSIPTKILSLDDLQAPPLFKELVQTPKGLILVTGPTGSGKSTTLAAMVDYVNENFSKHILTIEDPVEFIHDSKKSLVNHREVGASTKSFAKALKSALREDPDIILVGEMRDLETIQLAMTAAETGHLVMGTLHTSSAAKTIDRIIDVFPANEKEMVRAMLSVSLEAIITQTLLKRADGNGRVAAHEILVGTPAVRNLIRENKIPQLYSMIQTGSKSGMILMKDSITRLLELGIINSAEARRHLLTSSDNSNKNEDENRHNTQTVKSAASQF